MKKNNEIFTFVVGTLLEMKEVIISKQNKILDLNRMITHFSNLKKYIHTFRKRKSVDLNKTVIKLFKRKCEKEKNES